MAFILKPNQTYTYKGLSVENPYLVIDQLNSNKRDKVCHFVVEIYPSHEDRDNGGMVLEQTSYDVTGDEFDQYFAPAVIQADDDQYHQAYNYIAQVTNENDELVWDNWTSDEV